MPDTLFVRALFGIAASAALSLLARRARLLSRSGAMAATVVGASAVVAGPTWVALLLFFFATSSALSRWRLDDKRALLASIVEKGSERDGWQVLANGAVFGLTAIGSVTSLPGPWQALAAGALAAAAADTWSTEIGTVAGGTPRHILSGVTLPPGASGGITLVGTAGGLFGAVAVALLIAAMRWNVPVVATVCGGAAGMVVDSLLGAAAQERRWCARCGRLTERQVHSCGAATEVRGGIAGYGNDAVNLTSIIAGAVLTGVLA